MQGAEIDSEAKKNEIAILPDYYSNHCVVIMEQGAMALETAAPRWRISVTLHIRDEHSGARDPVGGNAWLYL
jgi:hypothetical protein